MKVWEPLIGVKANNRSESIFEFLTEFGLEVLNLGDKSKLFKSIRREYKDITLVSSARLILGTGGFVMIVHCLTMHTLRIYSTGLQWERQDISEIDAIVTEIFLQVVCLTDLLWIIARGEATMKLC